MDHLKQIARRAMLEYNLEPDFSQQALHELGSISSAAIAGTAVRDLRGLLWSSID